METETETDELDRRNPYYFYLEAEKELSPIAVGGSDKVNRALIARIQTGDKRAESELVVRNFRFVIRIVRRHQKHHIADAVESGFIGLIDAAKRFDLSRKNTFTTYAPCRIRAAIRDEKLNWRHIVLPEGVDKLKSLFVKLTDGFYLEHQRKPTHEEGVRLLTIYKLGKELKREPSEKEVEDAFERFSEWTNIFRGLTKRPVDLDEPVDDEGAPSHRKTKLSFFAESLPDPLDLLLAREELQHYRQFAARLGIDSISWEPTDRMFLAKRWLVPTEERWTLEQIGKKFGLSRESIRKREILTINRLTQEYNTSEEIITRLAVVIDAIEALLER